MNHNNPREVKDFPESQIYYFEAWVRSFKFCIRFWILLFLDSEVLFKIGKEASILRKF